MVDRPAQGGVYDTACALTGAVAAAGDVAGPVYGQRPQSWLCTIQP